MSQQPQQPQDVQPELILLLEENLAAQRLVVTWAKAFFEWGSGITDWADLPAGSPFAEEWSRISGVDVDDIERQAPILFTNGLLKPDGTVSDTAMGFCTARGLDLIPK